MSANLHKSVSRKECDLIPQDIIIFFMKAHFTVSFEMKFYDAVKARTKKLSDFKFGRFMSYNRQL